MADRLGESSNITQLVMYALQSITVLFEAICSFQGQDERVRALKSEVEALTVELELLLDTQERNPGVDFNPLKTPLHRCGKACNEYGSLIARFTKNPSGSPPSDRDLIKQKYLQGDIDDFKKMLGVYKSTINIALANAKIHITAISPNMLKRYKDKVQVATYDLEGYLNELDKRVQFLAVTNSEGADDIEWQAMLEEKESTHLSLQICAQLSAEIGQLGSTIKEHPQFSQRPSAHKYASSGLGTAKVLIDFATSQLRSHAADFDRQMEVVKSVSPPHADSATQMARLQEIKESMQECIKFVADVGETSTIERRNLSEDITVADNAYNISVSTTGLPVTNRRMTIQEKARNVSGQMNDESVQGMIVSLTRLDMKNDGPSTQQDLHVTGQGPANRSGATSEFHDRLGRGFRLSRADNSGNPLQAEGPVVARDESETRYAPMRKRTGGQ